MSNCSECGCILKRKKDTIVCRCGAICCLRHCYSYIDGNNKAITDNSPTFCRPCFKEAYPQYYREPDANSMLNTMTEFLEMTFKEINNETT